MSEDDARFKNKYRIASIRLKGYDYSQAGYYFITICTKNRICWFGEIREGKMIKSRIGETAKRCWLAIPSHFPFVALDEFVVMPNHVHGIIVINDHHRRDAKFCVSTDTEKTPEYNNKFGPQSKNLSSIIRGFKIGVKKIASQNGINFFWQDRFHDRIIRNEKSLDKIRQYIRNNPYKWESDRNNFEGLLI